MHGWTTAITAATLSAWRSRPVATFNVEETTRFRLLEASQAVWQAGTGVGRLQAAWTALRECWLYFQRLVTFGRNGAVSPLSPTI